MRSPFVDLMKREARGFAPQGVQKRSAAVAEPEVEAPEVVEELPEVVEDRAAADALKVGDFVSWNSSGGTARGKITRISRSESIDVPDSSFTIDASEEDPAALIRVYRDGDDGYEPSDRLVGHRFSTLTKIAALRFYEG